jgi:subtilisin family serine protease
VGQEAVPNQVVVGFEEGVGSGEQRELVEAVGGRLERRMGFIRAGVVTVRERGLAVQTLIRRLAERRGVAYAEPDYLYRMTAEPDDPFYPSQYALAPDGAGSVNAPNAWNLRTSCSKVAVLDTGTQYNHPDLSSNVWHNPDEIKGNGKDDDKNGYVDDYYGVNLIDGKNSGVDDEGHGTHVSGIIAGRGNNNDGISGLCWSGSIIPVKFMDEDGSGAASDAADGIRYAVKEGARIINASFGASSKSSALSDAIDYAKSKGTLIIAAAGNDGRNNDNRPTYPASYTQGNVIAVAAVTSNGFLASYSNYGEESVDLAAPGDKILSTYPKSTYKTLSGTSMAAPIVAATAAMVRSADTSRSYSDIRKAILSNTRPLSSLKGKVSHPGVLDAADALAAAG